MSNVRLKRRNARLQREYRDLLACPIVNCSAAPQEDDISKWHANIIVPKLDNTVFHFHIKYGADYPNGAPVVKHCTHITHPNVFPSYICLDILTMSDETKNTPFRGWTSAYTISSLLVQLQSFLFESIKTKGYGVSRMKTEAANFSCNKCAHVMNPNKTQQNIWPEIKIIKEEMICPPATAIETETLAPAVEEAAEEEEVYFFEICDNVVLSTFFEFCDADTLTKLRFLSEGNSHAVDLAFLRKMYKCFYTLKTLDDENMIMGLGAKTFIMPKRSRKTRQKTNCLQQLHGSFDYLSHEAYRAGIRNNIWKDRDFDWFCPLYINSTHGRRSIPLAEKCILELWNDPQLMSHRLPYKNLEPYMILNALTKLMNTTVVNMMKTVEDLEAGELQLFDSIKALEGYSSVHHLLLAFVDRYPQIKELANQKVKRFIDDPLMRDKEVTPDTGELLIDVAISDYEWDEFSPTWIEESFIRNARWILAKYPNLLKIENCSSCVRLTQSFQATRTGKRLAMFQRFFISEVCSPAHLRGRKDKNKLLLMEYNNRLGYPRKGMAEALQAHSRKVISCNNWWDYFELIDFCVPSAAHLSAWLRNSVQVSALKQYHSQHNTLKYAENWITQPTDMHQTDGLNCLCAGSLFKLPEGCKIVKGVQNAQPKLVQKAKEGIDICFVLDCTGSMGSWIRSAQTSIVNIIQTVTRESNSDVRFAIAGYRDHHSQGSGDDQYVVKKFDFTRHAREAEERVSKFKAAGGADYPEAMCCAMKAAADMSWNRESHQIVILIADAPPHGLVQSDDYPDGCPCGEDSLRIAHTMTKNGIVVYPVDCGRSSDARRQTFFHGLARITGGYALTLTDANILPEIVLGACREESLMHSLQNTIAPLYQTCLKNHAGGRFEQHCRSVYAECKARNISVQSSLPPDEYDETIEHQVDGMAFCMDLKQAKAMCESEYYMPINRTTKLSSYMERPVSQEQITKCMKRMDTKMAERMFLENGCQYKSAERFTKEAFHIRWKEFRANRGVKQFRPWNRLDAEKKKMYSQIPDGAKIRRAEQSTQKRISKISAGLITRQLIGKTVEVELGGQYQKVKILNVMNRGKVIVESEDGFKLTIKDTDKWRSIPKGWGNKSAAAEPAKVPSAKKEEPKEVKKTVAAPAPASPVQEVKKDLRAPEPQIVCTPSRAVGGPTSAQRTAVNYILGQMVECTQDPKVQVLVGTIVSLYPLLIQVGQNAPAIFRFVRPLKVESIIGDVVDVKSSPVVGGPTVPITKSNPVVGGPTIPTTKSNPIPAQPVAPVPAPAPAPKPTSQYEVGQMVNCTNDPKKQVLLGVVKTLDPLTVQAHGDRRARKFQFVRPIKTKEYICKCSMTVYAFADTRSQGMSYIQAGTRIQVADMKKRFAYIIAPTKGWVLARNKSRWLIVEAGKKFEKVLPTLIVSGLTEDITADDLKRKCSRFGFIPVQPIEIYINRDDGNRFAELKFERHGHAESIKTLGLCDFNTVFEITWKQEYLDYREFAL